MEGDLLARAREWAARITANAPLAVQATKESVLRGMAVSMEEAYVIETELAGVVFQSEDAKEGPAAFAEKRRPTGRAADLAMAPSTPALPASSASPSRPGATPTSPPSRSTCGRR